MIDVAGLELEAEDREILRDPLVGGVILFARNFADREQVRALCAEIRALRSPPLLIAVDQEGGRVQRFREGFYPLPPLAWLGRLHDRDPALAHRLAGMHARLMAIEVLDAGADFSFAPVVDIDYGRCEVIGDRAFHQDPLVVAELGMVYIQGMAHAGMAAVAKHFPGHGAVEGDSHLLLPEDHRELDDIQDDIRPYSSLIDAGLRGVMLAHVRYVAVDSEIASMSRYWIHEMLRGELGFRGAIFSDDLSMAGAAVVGDADDRSRIAMAAGADMILVCNDRPAVGPTLAALRGYSEPASAARLAAMRAEQQLVAANRLGSTEWQRAADNLTRAIEGKV